MLIVSFCILSNLGQAQEQTDNPNGQASQQQATPQVFPIPLPIEIIESQSASDTNERRAKESEQREIDDLAAQQGMNSATQAMNEATQDMRDYTFYSTLLVAAGTVLLIYTLLLTRQANKAAQETVAITRRIGEAQTRAYVWADQPEFIFGKESGDDPLKVRFVWRNSGSSPAKNCRSFATGGLCHPEKFGEMHDAFEIFNVFRHDIDPFSIPPNNGEMGNMINNFDARQIEQFKSGKMNIYLRAGIVFEDVFDTRLRVDSCLVCRITKEGEIETKLHTFYNIPQREV
ncbi:MAG: hypothetical protein WBO55_03020 [Rhizobiaceae bacterium]